MRRREGNEDDGRTSKGAGTQEKRRGSAHSGGFSPDTGGKRLPWSKRPGSHDKGQAAYGSITKRNNTWVEPWPEVATRLCGVDDGVAHRVDRLKAIGNGQVPAVVARAWQLLTYKS